MTTTTQYQRGARMNTRLAIALAASLTLAGCKDFLDNAPPDQAAADDAIVTVAGARTALAGAYAAMQNGYYYGGTMIHFGDLYADNANHTGTFTSYQEAAARDFFADNGDVTGMWQNIYGAIKRVNTLLVRVPLIDALDPVERDQILGEAHFLRALHYHNLVKHYGGVPLRLEPVTDPDQVEALPRATVEQVYTQIIDDLTQAEALMTNETSPSTHASLGAAKALLARVYLFHGDYGLAIAKAHEVDLLGYELAPNYASLFNNDAVETPENILKLTFTEQVVQANLFGYYWLSDQLDVGAGRFEMGPTQSLIDAYDTLSTDTRLAWNLKPDPTGEGWIEATQGGGSYGTKFPSPKGAEDYHVIRYAEVILIKAEAFARNNQLDSAVANLNLIRDRANLSTFTPGAAEVDTQAEVLALVSSERRKEFAEEGDRFTDLARDPANAVIVLGLANPNRLLFPIPQSEIDVAPEIVQNPGY